MELDEAGVISYCQICNAQTFGGVIFHAPLDAAAEIPEALLAHTHVIDHDVLRPFG